MTSYQARVLRWMTVLAVLIFAKISLADQGLASFNLENLSNSKKISAEQAIDNLRNIVRNGIGQEPDTLNLIDEVVGGSQRDAVIQLMRSGQSFIHVCDVSVDDSSHSGEDPCLEKLNELTSKGQLMATMNMQKRQSYHPNKYPMATAGQVKALYPFYTQDNNEGLILYLAVSSNDREDVGILDFARDFGLLSKRDNRTSSLVGAIYLVKLGKGR